MDMQLCVVEAALASVRQPASFPTRVSGVGAECRSGLLCVPPGQTYPYVRLARGCHLLQQLRDDFAACVGMPPEFAFRPAGAGP
jgi:hypothetical protein